MSSNTNFLSVSELDFLSVREDLKKFLSNQDSIKDYDYDGSNMSVVLDTLAWNTHLNNHYLNMVGTEMWMDTARLEDSMVSHAKELNYLPRSRSSSSAKIVFTIDTGADSPDSIIIPKNYAVYADSVDSNGVSNRYKFFTSGDTVVKRNAFGRYVSPTLEIKEGELFQEAFTIGLSSKYVMSQKNIDTSSIVVRVGPSSTYLTNPTYSKVENTYGLNENSLIFFVQGAYESRYEVTFGDNNFGKSLVIGEVVYVEYQTCSGIEPNGSSKFLASSAINGYSVSDIVTVSRATGGTERENIESIRYNAPRYFTTQARAVTADDFKSLVISNFAIENVAVYGGESVYPKKYGKVIISCKPAGADFISDSMKQNIIAFLSNKNLTVQPILVDPVILYMEISTFVKFNGYLTKDNDEQIKAKVLSSIKSYLDLNSIGFGLELKYSKLVRAIDDSETSITSNDTVAKIISRWKPNTGKEIPLVFSFNNKLQQTNKVSNKINNDPVVFSTGFKYLKNNILYDVILQDDGAGTLFLQAPQLNGSRILIENSVGSVNYETGEISASLNVFSYDTFIEIRALTHDKDISVGANLFLSYSDNYIDIEVVRE